MFATKRQRVAAMIALAALAGFGGLAAWRSAERERNEELQYQRGETELIVTNLAHARLRLFRAGANLEDAKEIGEFGGGRWLSAGNYFLRADTPAGSAWYPAPITGYRAGPDKDGSLAITIRPVPRDPAPSLSPEPGEFAYIPSGPFLLGDRLNPAEPHYVWLSAFYIGRFEVTNADFREFWNDPSGYRDDANWTSQGKAWKRTNRCEATALLTPPDAEYKRFGQADQPVVLVNWFEANAFCHWLTRKLGGGKWIFALPTVAEWEKVARGPDNFDYGLGMNISDEQARLYNWRKNPGAPVTLVGIRESRVMYTPNRYGVYHMSGSVTEWTQSTFRLHTRDHPYIDDDRNADEVAGPRVARGGSWYSASIALLGTSFRDAFQPEHTSNDVGFRVVARRRP
ncbi:MAG TPA: SUMF1/EgtB/PvdO family nonheme iron enzyme [Bryobacteraceae bacterium]|nr:SUMF1/EgtB/PvdO family nonheme iron enzyme [Bryobacteraceae bacterium]